MTTKAEKKPMTAAQIKKRAQKQQTMLRTGIQILFFLLAPSLFTSAFTGVKQLFTAIGAGEPMELSSFVWTLIALCGYTMLVGRFFCGYACAFGSLGDGVYFLSRKIQKKCRKKLPNLPRRVVKMLSYLPFVILTAIVVMCGLGVYGSLSGWSPWDVFSMVTALNPRLEQYVFGTVFLVLILAGMALESRFFCRFLCPMGAVFRILPIMPWAVLRRAPEGCIKGCSACKQKCPVDTELGVGANAGDCIRCGRCVGVCPKDNIHSGIPRLRGDELWITGTKAAVLLAIAAALGAVRFL